MKIIGVFALLVSCAGGDAAAGRQQSEDHNCLPLVWASQERPEKSFDVKNDRSGDDAISCATLTSPSAFARTIERIRKAATAGDRHALARFVDYPLIFIDRRGASTPLTSRQLTQRLTEVFTPEVLKTLSQLDLAKMQAVRNKGAMFASGAIWLSAPAVGAEPKIATINHQALSQIPRR
jgi:hypothetical protein